jgi:UDP-GlcNAc:undecaprenyl-phosphate GlcNAc-1-phosphate transferase
LTGLPDEARLIGAFLLALAAAFAATPAAISVAGRTDFHDRPVGYKGHATATPYLGGAAVLGGFLVAATLLGGDFARLSPIVACSCALWMLGTLDDRRGLPAWPRVAAECIAAMVLWGTGLGWDLLPGTAPDLALTVVWVVGLVNAFNLIDNMDGAAATLAAVTAAAVGALALIEGDVALATLAFGLAGACVGFLPYNLASPARIFLGDGGSLPIGFVVAASIMALPIGDELGFEHLLAAVLLAGLPVLDTTLVSVSRRRAGISLLTGGRDHLTHRLAARLGSARTVALALGAVQACLAAVAVGVVQLGHGSVAVAWTIWFLVATAAIVLLESSAWAPARDPSPVTARPRRSSGSDGRPRGAEGTSVVEGLVIGFIAVSCGLSPFLYGFYDVSVWGPIALGMLAALLGLLIARPAAPRKTALLATGALVAMWMWALLSTGWAESADQAMVEANRWLLYAALFGVLVLLLRNDRLGAVVLGAGTAAIGAFGVYLLARMFAGSAENLFFDGRLHEPLGYINGQAGYLLIGVWPLVAFAERARSRLAGAAAIGGASTLLGLVLLGQTRAVLPAFLVSIFVLLLVVPGRTRRVWALAAVAAGVAVAAAPVLHVYDSVGGGAALPEDAVIRDAALAILFGAMVSAAVWGAMTIAGPLLSRRLGVTRARMLAWAPLTVVVVVALIVGLTVVNDPVGRVADEYHSFVQLDQSNSSSSRFTTGAGNRYDYWRVAWNQFRDEPLRGVGAGNYDRTYFLERRTTEDIRQPHSIEFQALSELGIVGAGALLLFLAAVLFGFARRVGATRIDLQQRGLVVAAGGTFLVWLVHTSVDWLHLIPGVTGLALASAAVLVGPWQRPTGDRTTVTRRVVVIASASVIVFGAVLVGRSAIADKYRTDARDALETAPVRAISKANESLALDDEALDTYYVKAAGYAQLDDYGHARATLVEATRREPHDFVTWGLLGDLAVRRGDMAQARRDYRRAARLNPRSPSLRALASDPSAALER